MTNLAIKKQKNYTRPKYDAQINLRMKNELKDRLDEAAMGVGINRNSLILFYIKKGLGDENADEFLSTMRGERVVVKDPFEALGLSAETVLKALDELGLRVNQLESHNQLTGLL